MKTHKILGYKSLLNQIQNLGWMMFKLLFIMIFSSFNIQALELNESQSIRFYLEKNLELIATRYDIDLAKAEELTAGLWSNPSLYIDSQLNPFGKNWNQKSTGGPAQQDYILTVPVDINGKRRQAVRVARLATKVSEAEFQSVLREGLFKLLTSLYDLKKLKLEKELLLEKGQLLESLVLTLEKRIGSTSQPLIQSRARLAHEDVRFEVERNKIDQIEILNQLRVLLHLEGSEDIVPNVSFKSHSEIADQLESLIDNAKKNRPDFIALAFLKRQLLGQIELDRRQIFSDIGIQAGVSRQDAVGSRPGNATSISLPGAWSWLIGITIPLPVVDRNQGNVLQTKIRENQTSVREKFMLETVRRDIETSMKKIEITNLNLTRFKTGQLTNAKKVRDSASRQFGTGAMTLLEYLDAVDAYHVSIQKYLSAQYDLTSETLKLKLLAGQDLIL
jgi:cobalt-zinc-cadmium efflux system outer membrane protein